MSKLTTFIRHHLKDEDGALGIFGLYIFTAMVIMAGVAIDMSQLINARTQLQITADIAAHAALYSRDTKNAADSKNAALTAVEQTMPAATYGTMLSANDIVFGTYDRLTDKFTANANSRKAVIVSMARNQAHSNPVSSFLLQFVGFANFDMNVQSMFETYRPTCLREGFVAEGIVDIQSNNGFQNGFCIHSNDHVSVNQNNTFEPGTVVSMPNSEDIDLPNSGWDKNEGLQAALKEGAYRMRIVDRIPTIASGLLVPGSEYQPSYITNPTVVNVNTKTLTSALLIPGRVHRVTCNGGKLTIGGFTMSNVVIVTDCELKFSSGSALENAIIATTNTSRTSITAPSGLRIGKDDNCAAGGGAQVLTLGGVSVASKLSMYGGQILAKDDIDFAANANGIKGASMVAGGTVNGTSNMQMGFCGSGMELNFEAEYFRLVY